MKLLRYGKSGAERPGLLDSSGVVRDLSAVIADLNPQSLGDMGWLKGLDPASLPVVTSPGENRPLRRWHRQVYMHRSQLF